MRGLSRGFTLIEVLVAMAVFGVMAAMSYMALGQTLSNADMLTVRMDRLQAVQRTMSFLSTELMQASARPIRNEYGDAQPALISSFAGEFALQLTHGGWPNSSGVPRGTLQRTAWRIEDGELIRYHWNVLDRTPSNTPIATVMLDDVDSLTFRFLQDNNEWSDQWPARGAQVTSNSALLPRAVEITLSLVGEGELTRVIEVSE